MFKKFTKQFINLEDVSDPPDLLRIINQIQSNIDASFLPLTSNLQNDSTQLVSISLKASKTNIISHTLNRKLSGWKVVRLRGEATIWDTQDANDNPKQTLLLHTSADVVVDLEVF